MTKPSSSKSLKMLLLIITICIIACAALGAGYWFYYWADSKQPTANMTADVSSVGRQTADGSVDSNLEPVHHVENLVIAGPMASVSNPLIRLKNHNSLSDVVDNIEFRQWRDPNQMRAMVLNGEVDFIAMPTNTAANLYNKGVDLQLLNVSVWGILYIISNDETLSDLSQLKGKELVMPFRGDMPDIVLQRLLQAQGIEVGKDITIRYVANPIAAMKIMMMKQADYAVLVEPAVSMALNKSHSLPAKVVAPTLHRSIDLQQEWAKSFGTEPRMPQAGIAVVNPNLSPEVVDRFVSEYSKALQWTKDNADEASALIAKDVPMLNEKAIAQSIQHTGMSAVPATDAKPEIEAFFEQLAQLDNKLIGGKLPDDRFYYQPEAK